MRRRGKNGQNLPRKGSPKTIFPQLLDKKEIVWYNVGGRKFGPIRFDSVAMFRPPPATSRSHARGASEQKIPRKHSQKNDPVRGQKRGSEKVKKFDFFTLSEKSIFDTFRAMQKSKKKKEFLNAIFLFKKYIFQRKKCTKKMFKNTKNYLLS